MAFKLLGKFYFILFCFVFGFESSIADTLLDKKNIHSESFVCYGQLYNKTIDLWDSYAKHEILLKVIEKKLIKDKNTYALYEIQIYLHDFFLMLNRCNDIEKIKELVLVISLTFNMLDGEIWICSGCTEKSLNNQEVFLYSLQYIAFLSDVVFLVSSNKNLLLNAELERFLNSATKIITNHLSRWSTESLLKKTINKFNANQSIDNSSKYLLTDKEVWFLIAAINISNLEYQNKIAFYKIKNYFIYKMLINSIVKLINKRIMIYHSIQADGSMHYFSGLDDGFWNLYPDNSYAGYTGDKKPLDCISNTLNTSPMVSKKKLGWDFSHARRIVRLFETIERVNNIDLKVDLSFIDHRVISAFVNQLVYKIWNQNSSFPLFGNYWNGENGWYRVSYNNGSGVCYEGKKPYGLSVSFPTGGFITWGKYNPVISKLGKRLLQLSFSESPAESIFMNQYYSNIVSFKKKKNALFLLMFYSSLITGSI